MATEDIDLSWRLLLDGWHTAYEPNALVGMQVPSKLSALWAQRRRWARGQGEVLHVHLRNVMRWRHRRLWPLVIEGLASLLWIVGFVVFSVLAVVAVVRSAEAPVIVIALSWGIAVSVVAALQLSFALGLDFPYDRLSALAFLLAPPYLLFYWLISAASAVRSELLALIRGPAEARVVWDIPRDQLDSG